MDKKNVIACNGFEGSTKHPKVYLPYPQYQKCPYCSRCLKPANEPSTHTRQSLAGKANQSRL